MSDNFIGSMHLFVRQNEVELSVEKLLFVIGFKNNLIGTAYLGEAIVYAYNQSPERCMEIYKTIAQKYGSTVSRTEKSIRHAVYTCYRQGSLRQLNQLVGCVLIDDSYPPTNGELIYALSAWLRLERGEPIFRCGK